MDEEIRNALQVVAYNDLEVPETVKHVRQYIMDKADSPIMAVAATLAFEIGYALGVNKPLEAEENEENLD